MVMGGGEREGNGRRKGGEREGEGRVGNKTQTVRDSNEILTFLCVSAVRGKASGGTGKGEERERIGRMGR